MKTKYKQIIVEALHLDLEDLANRVNLTEKGKKKEKKEIRQWFCSLRKEPVGYITFCFCFSGSPGPHSLPWSRIRVLAHNAKQRAGGFIRNLILVGTIIMLIALVRHVHANLYLSSSSVTTTGTLTGTLTYTFTPRPPAFRLSAPPSAPSNRATTSLLAVSQILQSHRFTVLTSALPSLTSRRTSARSKRQLHASSAGKMYARQQVRMLLADTTTNGSVR